MERSPNPVYLINEAFASIQGEGRHTGRASLFLRFQGCDVGCPWCDTKHTWSTAVEKRVAPLMLRDFDGMDTAVHAAMDIEEVLALLHRTRGDSGITHVVITGGEPAAQQLGPLMEALLDERFTIQLETSGTYAVPMRRDYWMTLSPKVGMPGGRKLVASALARADEIKLPVGKAADIEAFLAEADRLGGMGSARDLIYLQPLSQSAKATSICVEEAKRRGWYVSAQVHKFIGIR